MKLLSFQCKKQIAFLRLTTIQAQARDLHRRRLSNEINTFDQFCKIHVFGVLFRYHHRASPKRAKRDPEAAPGFSERLSGGISSMRSAPAITLENTGAATAPP